MIEIRHYLTRVRQKRIRGMVGFPERSEGESEDCRQNRPADSRQLRRLQAIADGVWELRIDWGPGYRVYYAMIGRTCVLLLCGGDKRRQSADINRAVEYWNDYKRRTEER